MGQGRWSVVLSLMEGPRGSSQYPIATVGEQQSEAGDSPVPSQLLSQACDKTYDEWEGNQGVRCPAKGYTASHGYSWKRALLS